MINNRACAISLMICMFVASCATTKMSIYKDPAYTDVSYSSFVVVSALTDLDQKGYVEAKVCEYMAVNKITCHRGIDVFLPTRTYTDEQWIERFHETKAEALVLIFLTDSHTDQSYVPQTSTTTGNVYAYGNTASYNSNTYTYGGYSVNKPVERYEIKVIDAATGNVAFITSSETKGSSKADSKVLSDSLAEKFVQTLFENNLLRIPGT